MKITAKLQAKLNARIEFLESLFVINSYQDLVSSDPVRLQEQSQKMEREQVETVAAVLRCIRPDEGFKKQVHQFFLKAFKKIEPSLCLRQESTGIYKDIIDDFSTFFCALKQRNIVELITREINHEVYSYTQSIHVLALLIFRFLSLKSKDFIQKRLSAKANQPRANTRYLLARNDRYQQKISRTSSKSNDKGRPLSSSLKKRSLQASDNQLNNMMNISRKEISQASVQQSRGKLESPGKRMLRSANIRKNSIGPDTPEKPRKRIVKSFKDLHNEAKHKIYSTLQNSVPAKHSPARHVHFHTFQKMFRQQWYEYRKLLGLEASLDTREQGEQGSGGDWNPSQHKKKAWYSRNSDKIVVEACSRNDSIRRSMEGYSECYLSRFKN